MDFLFEPAPATDVADWLRMKAPLRKDQFTRLLPEFRALAFTVSGIHAADALQDLRDTVATFPEGERFPSLKKKLAAKLGEYLESDQLELVLDDEDPAEAAAARQRRLETRAGFLIRHHGNQAYARTVYQDLEDHADIFPYWKYLTVGDELVRASHRALNNVVLPKDHEFWQTHYPPWEFACRCQVVPVTAAEYARYQEADEGRPEWERDTLTDEMLRKLTDERKLVRKLGAGDEPTEFSLQAPIEKSTEPHVYVFNPGEFQIPINQILSRYDEATQKDFTKWAKGEKLGDGRTVWDWLNEGRRKAEGGRRKRPPKPGPEPEGEAPAEPPKPPEGEAPAGPPKPPEGEAPAGPKQEGEAPAGPKQEGEAPAGPKPEPAPPPKPPPPKPAPPSRPAAPTAAQLRALRALNDPEIHMLLTTKSGMEHGIASLEARRSSLPADYFAGEMADLQARLDGAHRRLAEIAVQRGIMPP